MNVRRTLCLVAVIVLLGGGLSMWRYLARLSSAGPSASISAPPAPQDAVVIAAVKALPTGTIAVDVPSTVLHVGDAVTVRATVRDRVSAAVARAAVNRGDVRTPGTTVTQLAVSERMKAQLYGDSDRVKIVPFQSDDGVLFGREHTIEWRWLVKPLAPGNTSLSLAVTALLDPRLAGSDSEIHAAVVDVPLPVAANLWLTARDALGQNWTWAWAAIVVPGADAAWAWYRRRREHLAASVANA